MSFKFIALAASAIVATATVAQADVSYFSYGETLAARSNLDLGTVRAASDGIVKIYDFRGGEQGVLLGSTTVNAGANQDVRVNVGQAPLFGVLAILTIDGQTVAIKDYDITRM